MRETAAAKKKKDFSIYDFTEEDAAAEPSSRLVLQRYRPRKRPDTPKPSSFTGSLNFLQAFTSGTNHKQPRTCDVYSIDLHMRETSGSCTIDISERKLASAEESSGLDELAVCSNISDHAQNCKNEYKCRRYCRDSLASEMCTLATPATGFLDDDDDETRTLDSISPSTTASDLLDNEDCMKGCVSDNGDSTSKETDSTGMEIVLSPDYVACNMNSLTEAQITFSSDFFKIEGTSQGEREESFMLEWELSDIVFVKSQWSEAVEAAYVEIHLHANQGAAESESDDDIFDDSSNIVKVVFTIHGRLWLEKEQKIFTLAERYRKLWNCHLDIEHTDIAEESDMIFSRDYFAEILEPFEDVIYPKGDSDAVSISRRDVELLQPDTFVNDTIIDFYIKYLKNKLNPEDNERFHFFNSFFFRKLVDLDRERGSSLAGREAFRRVRKWTRKVDIFGKDYIFVPVNFNLHWSLLVICHPGEVAKIEDDETKEYAKVPCILHMDSIKGNHCGLSNLVQSYLWEEWKERHPDSPDNLSSKFLNLRFLPLELPQQENASDCGLFLLHYVELFLEEAPINFSPSKITKYTNFLSMDWFEPSEASHKRHLIRKIIYDLIKDASRVTASTCGNNQNHPLNCRENDVNQETFVELLAMQSIAVNDANGDSVPTFADREDDIELVTACPVTQAKIHNPQSLVDYLKPDSPVIAAMCSQDRHHDHTNLHGEPCQLSSCRETSAEELAELCMEQISSHDVDGLVSVSTSAHLCEAPSFHKSVKTHEFPSAAMVDDREREGSLSPNSPANRTDFSKKDEQIDGYVPDSPAPTIHENGETCVKRDPAEVYSPVVDAECCEDLQDNNLENEDAFCSVVILSCREEAHPFPSQYAEDCNSKSLSDKEKQTRTDDSVIELDHRSPKRQKISNLNEVEEIHESCAEKNPDPS